MKKKSMLLALSAVFMAMTWMQGAYAHRITAVADPAKRCNNRGIDLAKCDQKRKKALQRGCITEEEYNALVQFNSYPTCDPDESGLNQLDGWCPCGCLHPNTGLSVEVVGDEGFVTQALANEVVYNRFGYKMITLDESADIEAGKMDLSKQGIALSTVGPALRPIIQINAEDGRVIRMTQTHPVVLANGDIKEAKKLRPEDNLLDINGKEVSIKSLQSYKYDGPVVNLATESKNIEGHVIFANGFAVGDLTLEAWLANFEKSTELRK